MPSTPTVLRRPLVNARKIIDVVTGREGKRLLRENHNSSTSALCALPHELLNIIVTHLSATEQLLLARACRSLRYLIYATEDHYKVVLASRIRDDGDDVEWLEYNALVQKGGLYDLAGLEERGKLKKAGLAVCACCSKLHDKRFFTQEQLSRPATTRKCVGADAKVYMCEHVQLSFAEVRMLKPRLTGTAALHPCDIHGLGSYGSEYESMACSLGLSELTTGEEQHRKICKGTSKHSGRAVVLERRIGCTAPAARGGGGRGGGSGAGGAHTEKPHHYAAATTGRWMEALRHNTTPICDHLRICDLPARFSAHSTDEDASWRGQRCPEPACSTSFRVFDVGYFSNVIVSRCLGHGDDATEACWLSAAAAAASS